MRSATAFPALTAALALLLLAQPVMLFAAVPSAAAATSPAGPRNASAASTPRPRPAARKSPPKAAAPTTKRAPLKLDVKGAARLAAASHPAAMQPAPQRDLSPNLRKNLYGPATGPSVEMGDRPVSVAGGPCGNGVARGMAELDLPSAATLLPDFNVLRPRTICARRRALVADYMFK